MKQHTSDFKTSIARIGRQFDDYITYGNTTLREELYSISLHYDGGLLKSIMKQLDIESSVDIPIGTKISYKKGLLVNGTYEYLDYGSFYVYKLEKSEDKRNYNITCYDAMLFSMVEYTGMSITFPITVRAYLTALCNKIGVPFLSSGDNFVNYNRQLQVDPFVDTDGNSLGFTIRDILDNMSQVTASNICIGKSGNTEGIEVRYITETNDTIDEDYLKDVNVNFGEKYGPINSIVLSRAGGSDNVYLQDEDSIEENGLCELKISDNEIMNFNDRSDYLPEILEKLDGLEYYVNDYSSTGICYYEPCDMYHIEIDNNTYQCIMFNDEINTTTGLEELVHTEIPEEAQTDYTKADKTDRKINKTNLIVDKQNQQIIALVTRTDEFEDTLTRLRIDVDGIETKVEGVYNITRKAFGTKTITLENCRQGYIIEMHIYGNNTVFEQLYPANDLFPADELFPYGDSEIVVTDENNNSVTYELGITEVLRANEEVQDECILSNGKVVVIRRVNPDGTTKTNITTETIKDYQIDVSNGTNTISIKNYTAKIDCVYIIENNYTDQFTTQIETQSKITQASNQIMAEVSETYETQDNANENYSRLTQTANEISTEVSKKVGNNEVISKINQSAEAVTINANKIGLQANDVINIISGNEINLTSKSISMDSTDFKVTTNGRVTCSNIKVNSGQLDMVQTTVGIPIVKVTNNDGYFSYMQPGALQISNDDGDTEITGNIIYTGQVIQTSQANKKKNFEKFENALEYIKQIDIYKYNLQTEKGTDKKHLGFVIGGNYNYSDIVTSKENNGVDVYAFVSLCCKAIQEQQAQIEELKNEIKLLKGEK